MVRNFSCGILPTFLSGFRMRLIFVRKAVFALGTTIALAAAIIGGLPAASLVAQSTASTQAQETALKDALFRMRQAIDRYYIDKKQYPATLKALATARYIETIPTDPFTNRTDSWLIGRAKRDPKKPTAARGIYDVKSASNRKAMDGTKYSQW
jgi:general secretion pathway protein G